MKLPPAARAAVLLFFLLLYISPAYGTDTVANVTVNNNNQFGVYFYSDSNITVVNVTASNNTDGIHLFNSSYSNFSASNIFNNTDAGAYLNNTSTNNIFYNNIFNNTQNVRSTNFSNAANFWNTTQTGGTSINGGATIGGNFWALPSGTGFSQNCTDSDSNGICDSAYTVNTSNIDYLPLANASTPVAACSNLTTAGAYSLNQNLAATSITCINIQANNIILNCNTYTISLSSRLGGEDGIAINGYNNTTILGCKINGFDYGVNLTNSMNNTISNTNISNSNTDNLYLSGATDNNFLNVSFNTTTAGAGIALVSSSNFNIFNNASVSGSGTDGFSFQSGSNFNNVTNSTVYANSGYGVNVSSSTNNTFYTDYFNNTNNAIASGSPNFNYWNVTKAAGVNILGQNINTGGNYWTGPATGYSDKCWDDNGDAICDATYTISANNTDNYPLVYTLNLTGCTQLNRSGAYNLASNMTGTTNAGSGICVNFNSNSVRFNGNGYTEDITSTALANSSLIYVNGFNYSAVKNIHIGKSNYNFYGMFLKNSNYGNYTNLVANLSTGAGVYLEASSYNIFSNISPTNANDGGNPLNGDGIQLLSGSNFNNFTGINATGNSVYDVKLVNSNNNSFNNSAFYATSDGYGARESVYMSGSSGNIFFNNTLPNNGMGFYIIANSNNNLIYNNLLNNTLNVYSNNSTNIWNTSKTAGTNIVGGSYMGGNFWALPNGTGYSQNCTSYDGICDSTYTFNTTEKDYLPLAFTTGLSCSALNTANTVNTMTANLSISNSLCFNVTAANITLNCNGYTISGNNTTGTYGVFSNQFNTTVKNCNIKGLQYGIYFLGATNGTINNVTTNSTHASGEGIFFSSTNYSAINNTNALSASFPGIQLTASSYNTISNTLGKAGLFRGITIQTGSNNNFVYNNTIIGNDNTWGAFLVYSSSSNNIIANNTINGLGHTYAATMQVGSSTNNTFVNNTFFNATNLLYLDSGAGRNVFYWNNFTSVAGFYVNDTNGTNLFNTSSGGVAQGNTWANVVNGSVQIKGVAASPFTGLYYGYSGTGYPYNNSTSVGRLFGNVVDYGPLTTTKNSVPNLTISSINNSTGGITYLNNGMLVGWAQASDGDSDALNYTYSWYLNGALNASGTAAAVNNAAGTLVNVANITGGLATGQNWTLQVTATDGTNTSAGLNSTQITITSSNTAPTASISTINNSTAGTTFYANGRLVAWAKATDAESSSLTIYYKWYLNGALNTSGSIAGVSNNTLTNIANVTSGLAKNQNWVFEITASDGSTNSTALNSSQITISDSAPTTGTPTLSPIPAYKNTSQIVCTNSTTTDIDGDSVSYNYQWFRNRTAIAGANSTSLANSSYSKGDSIICQVTPSEVSGVSSSQSSNASTFANNNTVGDGNPWFDPENAQYSDDIYSNPDIVGISQYLKATNFSFSIPSDATITGIAASVERQGQSDCDGSDNSVKIVKGGSILGDDKALPDVWPCAVDGIATYGNSTDLWGLSWTPSDINAADFGFVVSEKGGGGENVPLIDYMNMTVYYTTTGGVNGTAANSSSLTISNAPPTTAAPSISPSPAYKNTSTLTCTNGTTTDPDGDNVAFSYLWFLNGSSTGINVSTISNSSFSKGDSIVCQITPNDGAGGSGSQGPNNGATFGQIDHGAGVSWNDVENAQYSDDAYASYQADSDTSNYLEATNFSFSIPSDATITGIKAEIEKSSENGDYDASVRLVKGSSVQGDDKADPSQWPVSDAYVGYGNSTDLWGLSWSPSDINSANFGIVISGQSSDPSTINNIDNIRMTVYYILSGTNGAPMNSSQLTISNFAPSMSISSINNSTGGTTYLDNNRLVGWAQATDGDSDALNYTYKWYLNGALNASGTAAAVNNAAGTLVNVANVTTGLAAGQNWTLEVAATDGSATSAGLNSTQITIAGSNTAPTVSSSAIQNSTSGTSFVAGSSLLGYVNGTDAESSTLTYYYKWYLNGALNASGSASGIAKGSNTNIANITTGVSNGQHWVFEVTASDGSLNSSALNSSQITISDTAPTTGTPNLSPIPAYKNTSAIACTNGTTSDVDGDSVSFFYLWFKNGASIGTTASTLANSSYVKGDSIVCQITPFDGSVNGTAKNSSALVISNAPSSATSSLIQNSSAGTMFNPYSTLVGYGTATDIDGDNLNYTYKWYLNGAMYSSGTASQTNNTQGVQVNVANITSGLASGQNWTLEITATDGTDTSAPVNSSQITITSSCYCDLSSNDCLNKINNPSCTNIYLTQSGTVNATFINNPANFSGKVLDCQLNSVSGIANSASTPYGILLGNLVTSTGSTIQNCRLYNFTSNDASGAGIKLQSGASAITITGTTLQGNAYGVYSSSSNSNLIYNNYFNNTQNVFTSASANFWNTTKSNGASIIGSAQIGGNFWAAPNGTGFSQACLDSNGDGICDTSYTISGSETDYLPLTSANLSSTNFTININISQTNYITVYTTSGTSDSSLTFVQVSPPAGGSITLISNETSNMTGGKLGFLIRNDGNVNVSVAVASSANASAFIGGSNPAFQIFGANNESGSCPSINTTLQDLSGTPSTICPLLYPGDSSDTIWGYMLVRISSDSPPQNGTAVLTFTSTAA